jgi:hypothetical protein
MGIFTILVPDSLEETSVAAVQIGVPMESFDHTVVEVFHTFLKV